MITKYKPLDFITFKLFSLFLLALYPLAIISGNLLTNIFILLISLSFFINFKDNKKKFTDKIFYILGFFFISLLVNTIFSIDPQNSFPRVIKILLIIFFILEIKRLIETYEKSYLKYIFLSWFLIFFVLSLDIIFEVIFGYNTIGIKSYMPGRIASFFGDELVAGGFYHGFILFFLSYLFTQKINNNILLIIIISVLLISFLIGERSNFIKIFLSIIIFSILVFKIDYKIKISVLLIFLISVATIISFNDYYKSRYFSQIKTLFSKNGYSKYMKQSQYGAHRDAAIKILNENFIFGVGLKNYRYEVGKKKYENKDYLSTNTRVATHPHQIHHELLSETGIFGYLCFLIFLILSLYLGIKNYIKNKSLYLLSSIIFIITSILPLLPSGSFFTTFTSGIFWLNFAIMFGFTSTKS